MAKFIFVTGGVVSGLGKGITAASLGALLKARGFKVAAQKLDPYINVDPGTMSPLQHGEVFVTEDGAETDLDLGHYERFIDENLNRFSNLTTGKVYLNVLEKEREGAYLGHTVQVIPHVTDEIKHFVYSVQKKTDADIVITEIGGTVGDIESQPFLEAIRQIGNENGPHNSLFIHVVLIPWLEASEEHKSKPAQHSVKELQSYGIAPDIIIARADRPLEKEILDKLSMFCNVKPDCVIENRTLSTIYEAPLMLEMSGFADIVLRELAIKAKHKAKLGDWVKLMASISNCKTRVNIALVGKYVSLHDAYLSVAEALKHAGWKQGAEINLQWVDSDLLKKETIAETFAETDAIIVPGGFGVRGTEGMILAAQYAREHSVPYFGICLGMQIAVIEFARHVLGLEDANSSELNPETVHPVIDLMPEQKKDGAKGGTMRLGAYPCQITPGSKMMAAYKTDLIQERHRHRYEFNNAYREAYTSHGMLISGNSPDGRLAEAVELPQETFYIGVQYHPEFKSRPNRPHPLFMEFIRAAVKYKAAMSKGKPKE